jgi:hypothetical protein
VRAVFVNKDAAQEAKIERRLNQRWRFDEELGSPLGAADAVGRGVPRPMGEEVFLSQLHRRALLLNEGFQNQILKIISRHETATRVESESSQSQSNRNSTTTRFSADFLLSSSVTFPSSKDLRKGSDVNVTALQSTPAQSLSFRAWASSEQSWPTNVTDGGVVLFDCLFADGVGSVEVHQAPVKT